MFVLCQKLGLAAAKHPNINNEETRTPPKPEKGGLGGSLTECGKLCRYAAVNVNCMWYCDKLVSQ